MAWVELKTALTAPFTPQEAYSTVAPAARAVLPAASPMVEVAIRK